MQQRLAGQIIINHRRRRANSPETQPGEQEVRRVGQVEVDVLARLDAERKEELRVLVRELRGLLVRVGAGPRPDAFGVGLGEDGVFEEVVEGEAVLLGCFLFRVSYGFLCLVGDVLVGEFWVRLEGDTEGQERWVGRWEI